MKDARLFLKTYEWQIMTKVIKSHNHKTLLCSKINPGRKKKKHLWIIFVALFYLIGLKPGLVHVSSFSPLLLDTLDYCWCGCARVPECAYERSPGLL